MPKSRIRSQLEASLTPCLIRATLADVKLFFRYQQLFGR